MKIYLTIEVDGKYIYMNFNYINKDSCRYIHFMSITVNPIVHYEINKTANYTAECHSLVKSGYFPMNLPKYSHHKVSTAIISEQKNPLWKLCVNIFTSIFNFVYKLNIYTNAPIIKERNVLKTENPRRRYN